MRETEISQNQMEGEREREREEGGMKGEKSATTRKVKWLTMTAHVWLVENM